MEGGRRGGGKSPILWQVFSVQMANSRRFMQPSTLRDWPPCPPIQRGGGRRSRPGVTPFISALTVARCPATFPGVWPQLRDTLSTSRSVGRGTGAFIYLPPFSENRPIFCSFPFAKIQPVFLPEQTVRKKNSTPFPPSATPAGITHYTLLRKVVCQMGALPPLETPTRKGGTLPLHGAHTAFSEVLLIK